MQEFLLFNILLPNQCIICQQLNQFNLCNDCIAQISNKSILWLKENNHSIFKPKENTLIQNLDKNSYIKGILSCTDFKHKIIKKSIHYLKYKNLPQLANPLGAIMLRTLSQHLRIRDNLLLCPIPLHSQRLQFRGYNQADLLSQYLHKQLKLNLYLDLHRIRNTSQQMRIQNRQNRVQNMDNAFQANRKNIENQTIILIDDVTTTLSTIQQAAKALSQQGFNDIYALILAH
jgi:ComF family protein